MKKLLAIIVTVALLSCAFIIPVSAADDAENDLLYLDSFKKMYVDEEGMGAELLFYDELYYSKDDNGDVEWVFVYAMTNMLCPEIVDRDFHGVHVQQANIYVPFEFGYGLYDVKEDRFYDLTEVSYYNETHDTPKYEYAFDLFKSYYKPEKTGNQYEAAFVNWSVSKYGDWCLDDGYSYNELYTHYDGDHPDWVFCQARYFVEEPVPINELWIGGAGGRYIRGGSIQSPFEFGYGVYDVEKNEYYALEELVDNYSKYEGLIDKLAENNIGALLGDVNGDNTVDILDATVIQKCAADKIELNYKQEPVADVNGDHFVDVIDATDIQKYAAA